MKNKFTKYFAIFLLSLVIFSTFVISSSAASSVMIAIYSNTDFIMPFNNTYSFMNRFNGYSYDFPYSFSDYDIVHYYYENMGDYLNNVFGIDHYDYVPIVLLSNTSLAETEYGYFYSYDHPNNFNLFNDWSLDHDFVAVTVLDDQSVDQAQPWGTPIQLVGGDLSQDHDLFSLLLVPVSSNFVHNSPYIDVFERATYDQFDKSLYGLTYNSIGEFMFEDLNGLSYIQELVLHLLCAAVWIVLLSVPVVLVFFLLRLIF